jgi:hypothetical protein
MDTVSLFVSFCVLLGSLIFLLRSTKKFKLAWKLGIRVVCISDTHGDHEKLVLPTGDILIHAGDFTRFGRVDHAEKFNSWLAEQKVKGNFQHVIVVNGNHENNVCELYPLQIIASTCDD